MNCTLLDAFLCKQREATKKEAISLEGIKVGIGCPNGLWSPASQCPFIYEGTSEFTVNVF